MKILMLATEYPPAKGYSLARYTFDLAAALVQSGEEVHVISLDYCEGREELLREGVHVHLMTESLGFQSFHWVSNMVLDNVRLLERAVAIAEKHGPFDLIAAHDWCAALTAKSLKTIYHIPFVLTIHDLEVRKQGNQLTREQSYIAEMEGWICQYADRIVTTSRFLQKELGNIYKIPANQIHVVPYGVNPDHFMTDCNLQDFRRLFTPDDGKAVLFAARLTLGKGPQILLKAAEEVGKKVPGTAFIFVGEGDLELSQKAEKLPGIRIFFPGSLEGKALAATYRIADCLVVPGLYEPFGMAALEAMVCGTPVIASDTGGLSEIIEHNATGLKIPSANAEALSQAIMTLLSEPRLAQSLAKQAKEEVQKRYCWKDLVLEIKKIYENARDNKSYEPQF